MKLLFVHGGSRVKINSKGTYYIDGNFNNQVLLDYKKLCGDCTFLLRVDQKKYDDKEIEKFNKLDKELKISLVSDVYASTLSRFNFIKAMKIKSKILNLVKDADKVIIRSVGNFYTNYVLKCCKKLNKPYLIEVTGFAFEGLWYHSYRGKLLAYPRELKLKNALKNAPYALYVTNEALQKRYPCKGKTLGCSDVRLYNLNNTYKIHNLNRLSFVTVAFIDVKWKGQKDVLKALLKLKKEGYEFDYYLVGSGNGTNLKRFCKKNKLLDNVHFVGPLVHEEVFKFIRNMDVYIQPSYQEGLCRAIVEAMSVGLPVIATNVGGNYELIAKDMIYEKKNISELVSKIKSLNEKKLIESSNYNFNKAQEYKGDLLDLKRNDFYIEFISNK